MECAYEPYNWVNTDGSSFGAVPISSEGQQGLYANGYDVQIAQYVANRLGLKLEIYAMEWDSLIPAVNSGAIDAIVAGMSLDGRACAGDRLHRYLLRIQPRGHHPQVNKPTQAAGTVRSHGACRSS